MKKNDLYKKLKEFVGLVLIEKKNKKLHENIYEIGYKYQMTDLGATVGLEGLKDFKKVLNHRKKIFNIYLDLLQKNKNILCVNKDDGKELRSLVIHNNFKKKDYIQKKLGKRIETNQVHFRNDKYSILGNL